MQWRIQEGGGLRDLPTPPPSFLACHYENSYGLAFSMTLNNPLKNSCPAPPPRIRRSASVMCMYVYMIYCMVFGLCVGGCRPIYVCVVWPGP